MKGTPTIVRAGFSDAARVSELIATAFHHLAVARWLVPDPHRRARILPANFRILVDHALTHGQVHIIGDQPAAAVWFPRGDHQLPEPTAYQQRLAAACGDTTPRFQALDTLFELHHPAQPHHHLAFLAVHPARQRRGYGSALLAHHHAVLDAHSTPAYLEATSEGSRDLYRRHGYQVIGAPFCLPDATPIWPMWRPPGTGSEAVP